MSAAVVASFDLLPGPLLAVLLLQGVVKQHPSPQMTCFAMLDSEEP